MASSSESHLQKVFVPDPVVAFVSASVVRHVDSDTVEVTVEADYAEEDTSAEATHGATRQVKESLLMLNNPASTARGCDDMIHLGYLHEPAILFNLRQRFLSKLPYTFTGPICIAVNPYDWLDIYGEDLQWSYFKLPRRELPPHIYAISADAYRDMRLNGYNQSILVSGESGAGKTETTKILMEHLSTAGDKDLRRTDIVERVLKSNPLMEAFGNAKTVRNDNSSRFGKFGQLQFNRDGNLIGIHAETYLLEKSRVVSQGSGERNYHVFYQVLAAPKELRTHMGLESGSLADYAYVNSGGVEKPSEAERLSDAEGFGITCDALQTIGFSESDQLEVFTVLGAILRLGNMKFQEKGDDRDLSEVSLDPISQSALRFVASVLHVKENELSKALCQKSVATRNETFSVPLNCKQAANSQSALAVALYQHLFTWLIQRINESTANSHLAESQIGILDIFGFEVFQKNSFEQFCINYANEKLQQKFNDDVFKNVQLEYEQEGIPWSRIEYRDNEAVLNLVEGKMGLITFLNEECMLPKGSDEKFVNKVATVFKDNEHFTKARLHPTRFTIKHYAGLVEYDSVTFCEKNRDELLPDLDDLLRKSSASLIKKLFKNGNKKAAQQANTRRSTIILTTIGTQFQQQLGHLMDNISRTKVHYIRCIKPNSSKSPKHFSKMQVTLQLRYAGVVEAIRVSRASFPNRMPISECIRRFRMLCPNPTTLSADFTGLVEEDIRAMCQKLLGQYLFPGTLASYVIGRTKVFFAAGILEQLESRRSKAQSTAAIVVQKTLRRFFHVAKYRRARRSAIIIQRNLRKSLERCRYTRVKDALIVLQSIVRMFLAKRSTNRERWKRAAIRIQSWARMHRARSFFLLARQAIVRIQAVAKGVQSRQNYYKIVEQVREEAKLENQVKSLHKRLEDERQLRQTLEMQNKKIQEELASKHSSATVPYAVAVVADQFAIERLPSSDVHIMEDMQDLINQLRSENSKIKEANRNLKSFNTQLRKDNVRLERGLAAGGASFAAVKEKAKDLHTQLIWANEDRAKLRSGIRTAKAEANFAIKEAERARLDLNMAVADRDALGRARDEALEMLGRLELEVRRLEALNNRMVRGVLRRRSSLIDESEPGLVDLVAIAEQIQKTQQESSWITSQNLQNNLRRRTSLPSTPDPKGTSSYMSGIGPNPALVSSPFAAPPPAGILSTSGSEVANHRSSYNNYGGLSPSLLVSRAQAFPVSPPQLSPRSFLRPIMSNPALRPPPADFKPDHRLRAGQPQIQTSRTTALQLVPAFHTTHSARSPSGSLNSTSGNRQSFPNEEYESRSGTGFDSQRKSTFEEGPRPRSSTTETITTPLQTRLATVERAMPETGRFTSNLGRTSLSFALQMQNYAPNEKDLPLQTQSAKLSPVGVIGGSHKHLSSGYHLEQNNTFGQALSTAVEKQKNISPLQRHASGEAVSVFQSDTHLSRESGTPNIMSKSSLQISAQRYRDT